MDSHDRGPRRTYTQTELGMSYGVTAGLLVELLAAIRARTS